MSNAAIDFWSVLLGVGRTSSGRLITGGGDYPLDIDRWKQGFQKHGIHNVGIRGQQHLLSIRTKEREGVKMDQERQAGAKSAWDFVSGCEEIEIISLTSLESHR